jgi:hypothetical protein
VRSVVSAIFWIGYFLLIRTKRLEIKFLHETATINDQRCLSKLFLLVSGRLVSFDLRVGFGVVVVGTALLL